ncbi:MAG: YbjQ family protein [Gemmatimonadaceae bacterium]
MDEAILHRARQWCRRMSETELLNEYARLSDQVRPEARLALDEEVKRRNLDPPPPVVRKHIVLTTASGLDGYRVARTLEIISAERSFAINVSFDLLSRQLHGEEGLQDSVRNVFRDARRTCLADLRREAEEVGADAVIAVSLEYRELSNLLFVVVSGTAVQLEPVAGAGEHVIEAIERLV